MTPLEPWPDARPPPLHPPGPPLHHCTRSVPLCSRHNLPATPQLNLEPIGQGRVLAPSHTSRIIVGCPGRSWAEVRYQMQVRWLKPFVLAVHSFTDLSLQGRRFQRRNGARVSSGASNTAKLLLNYSAQARSSFASRSQSSDQTPSITIRRKSRCRARHRGMKVAPCS